MKFILINDWLRYLAVAQANPGALKGAKIERPSRYSRFAGAWNVFAFDEVLVAFLVAHKLSHTVQEG